MTKRFIGIDLEGIDVRVAVLTAGSGKIDVVLDKREYDSPAEAAAAIVDMVGGKLTLGDRLATALPCRVGLFRRIRFPFREKNKIEASLPLELASQLPVPLSEHVISFLSPRAQENDYEVDAVVVNKLEIDELLTHFPDPEQNPRHIDLYPFALLPALADRDGILVYCRRLEVVVALIYEGMVWDYRLLPGTSESGDKEVFDFISHQVGQLENAIGVEGLPFWVLGAGVTEDLLLMLYQTDRTLLSPAADVFGDDLGCEMAPAALLALAEMRSNKKEETLNFRKGDFSARGQLEIFRTKLIVAALLFLLVVIGGSLTMYTSYLQKTGAEKALKKQMANTFVEVMPANTTIVDVPLQMKAHLADLRQQVQVFGLGGQGAVTVLQALSKNINRKIQVDFDEFSYFSKEVRITGRADSFDAVNQIAELLKKGQMFTAVEITDAKLAGDNSLVNFELQLNLNGGEGL